MSPLRIIILVVLFYIAWRLIFGGRKASDTAQKNGRSQASDRGLNDTLKEDPVCKKLVPSRQAVQFEWRGKKLYFCSQECCNTFRTNQGEK
ncbi:MAG: YHS domain-containing protein [Proteobacteria bacterium]|nr:YHS domain-containing protein [Pseudomonadota bacterium]